MMNQSVEQIGEAEWRLIVKRIQLGQCIPFLGAGVNRGTSDDENLPLGSELALSILQLMTGVMSENLSDLRKAIRFQSLEDYTERTENALAELKEMLMQAAGQEVNQTRVVEIFKGILPNPEDVWMADLITNSKLKKYEDLTRVALQDLARVSLHYYWETDEHNFMTELQALIPDTERKPSKLLTTLAALPFKLLVTTNYDRLMERAMELLHAADIRNPAGLLARLKEADDLLSVFLRENFSEELRACLAAFDPATEVPKDLLRRALSELNLLLQEKSIHHLGEEERDETGRSRLVGIRPPAAAPRGRVDQKPLSHHEVRQSRLLLEFAYPDLLRPHRFSEVIIQPIRGFQDEDVQLMTDKLTELELRNGLALFKLHGSFQYGGFDTKRRPVITEEDYIEFMTYVLADNINRLITSKFQDSTLLFLGYGLEDWTFRVLFKGLIERLPASDKRKSFAIQKSPSSFWKKYWQRKGVEIYDMDSAEFAEQLEYYYGKYAEKPAREGGGGAAAPRPLVRGPIRK